MHISNTKKYNPISLVAIAAALALTGCSKADGDTMAAADATMSAEAASDAASETAPNAASVTGAGVGGNDSVAPGVAFTYEFAFRLPDDQVSVAQDRHVEACARLGRARCRVANIHYTREDDGPIDASLNFLVDPALARSFARDAVDLVDQLDGELTSSQVGGVDVGTGIDNSQRLSANLGGDLERIERRLAQPGLSGRERAELQQQAQNLRGELRGEEAERREGEAKLAATPVNFTYVGNTGALGYDGNRPFASAFAASGDSLAAAGAFILMLAGIALPWALMLGGLILGWRWLRRRLAPTAVSKETT
ncbi:MAG: DUF4349 domain-containing protein [Sphingopyxis sp.]